MSRPNANWEKARIGHAGIRCLPPGRSANVVVPGSSGRPSHDSYHTVMALRDRLRVGPTQTRQRRGPHPALKSGSSPKEHPFRAHGEPGGPSLMFQYTLRRAASSWSLIPLDFASQPHASPVRYLRLLISREFSRFSCHFSPFATHMSVIAVL